eukprot:gnl/Carplike_NY0171/3635_a4910_338.p1 GENE.gnl/Carplike_NY0171/3635_a4910_338~~gnl/Carplike_NY0171/3635_a4910_338.p1  ORF type:complete len:546 (+),score=49.03 gnl/Carplike_NY0171/3635_a4910_338:133-1638(+)
MSDKEREESLNEVRVLASIYDPHVIAYFDSFAEKDKLFIIMEYSPKGDLSKRIKQRKLSRNPFPEDTVWLFFIQMCLGLQSLHKKHILHRDLKSANIFINDDKTIKIGDLGVARVLKGKNSLAKTSIGTPYYISPEIWRNVPYDAKSDIWSLGCLLYEMLTFKHPFDGRDMRGLAHAVLQGKYHPIPSRYSRELASIVAWCLQRDSSKRPSIDEILVHPAIRSRLSTLPLSPSIVGSTTPHSLCPTIKLGKRFGAVRVRGEPILRDVKLPSPAYEKRRKYEESILKDSQRDPKCYSIPSSFDGSFGTDRSDSISVSLSGKDGSSRKSIGSSDGHSGSSECKQPIDRKKPPPQPISRPSARPIRGSGISVVNYSPRGREKKKGQYHDVRDPSRDGKAYIGHRHYKRSGSGEQQDEIYRPVIPKVPHRAHKPYVRYSSRSDHAQQQSEAGPDSRIPRAFEKHSYHHGKDLKHPLPPVPRDQASCLVQGPIRPRRRMPYAYMGY